MSGGWALTSSNADAAAALPEHAAPNVSSNVEDDDFWGGRPEAKKAFANVQAAALTAAIKKKEEDDFWGGGPEAQAKAFADAQAAALAAAKTVF